MIKLIIFDLDGVLVEAKKIHFESLNEALEPQYRISWDEHLSKYDGLKTNQKLGMLTKEKGLPFESHNIIWDKKQFLTIQKLNNIEKSHQLIQCLSKLTSEGFKIVCCSNSIRKTILIVLSRLGIIEYFDLILDNFASVFFCLLFHTESCKSNGRPLSELSINNFCFVFNPSYF